MPNSTENKRLKAVGWAISTISASLSLHPALTCAQYLRGLDLVKSKRTMSVQIGTGDLQQTGNQRLFHFNRSRNSDEISYMLTQLDYDFFLISTVSNQIAFL
jgi:hypothetical protein